MTQRRQLMRAMHRQGLRLDDAATAADVAVQHLREQRNQLIVAARAAGLGYRQIACMTGLTKSQVHRICMACPIGPLPAGQPTAQGYDCGQP